MSGLVLVAVPEVAAAVPFTYVLQLDGVDDYAVAPDSGTLDIGTALDEDFTAETFFFVPDQTNTSTDTLFWHQGSWGLYILYNVSGTTDRFIFRLYTGPVSYVFISYDVSLDNGWHHVAAAFDNENTASSDLAVLYLDGAQVKTGGGVDWTPGLPNSSSSFYLGAYAGVNPTAGRLDEVRLSGTLRYTGSYAVPTSPFIMDSSTRALWHLNDMCSNSFMDSSGNANTLAAQGGAKIVFPSGVQDCTPPVDPVVSSSSHTIGAWSQDRTVDVSWSGASDATSGVDGFSYLWDNYPSTLPDKVKDAEETATGTTSPPLGDGARYFHLRTRDNTGNWTSTVHRGPFRIDDTNPTGAQITSAAFSENFQTSTSFKVSWAASDATSGVASYASRYKSAPWNGGFGSYTAYAGANGSTFAGSAGRTYCFDVLATDRAGNSARSPQRCTATPLDDRALSASAAWSRLTGSAYYRGTTTRTATQGAQLTRSGIQAKRITILVTKCPTCGTVDVFLGPTLLKRISLFASNTANKALVPVASFPSSRTGTVTIKVVSSGKPVSVDGLAIGAV